MGTMFLDWKVKEPRSEEKIPSWGIKCDSNVVLYLRKPLGEINRLVEPGELCLFVLFPAFVSWIRKIMLPKPGTVLRFP